MIDSIKDSAGVPAELGKDMAYTININGKRGHQY
jgi:hypothetical protein